MVRALFTFAGGSGHFRPMVPFALAVAAAGHTVAVAAGAARRASIEAAGFPAFAVTGGPSRPPERQPLLAPDRAREDHDHRGRIRPARGHLARFTHAAAMTTTELCPPMPNADLTVIPPWFGEQPASSRGCPAATVGGAGMTPRR